MTNRDRYNAICTEWFDISDTFTRKVLIAVNEEDQNKVMVSLAGKLYEKIVDKVDDIDYGKIPDSKGDITKIPNFVELEECLHIIRDLIIQYNQPTSSVDTVIEAIDNMKDSKKIWERSFAVEVSFPIVFYNNIALAIVGSTSLLISNSIEFIKDPMNDSFDLTLDKVGMAKTEKHLLFKNLKEFNKAYKKGEVTKVMDQFFKLKKEVSESSIDMSDRVAVNEELATILAGIGAGIVLTASLVMLINVLLNIIRELITMFYCARQKVSDYYAVQSELLALNAENVKLSTTKTPEKRKAIYKRQVKIAERYKKISNFFCIKMKGAEKEAASKIASEKKKYKVDDVVDTLPASASSVF